MEELSKDSKMFNMKQKEMRKHRMKEVKNKA